MKIVIALALAALVSVAFALDSQQITCLPNGAGITVQLADTDYTKYSGAMRAKLAIGACSFDASGKLDAGEDCGVKQDVQGSTIINSAVIKSAPPTTIITRLPVVEVMVACTYNTATKQSAQSFINPNLETIKGDLQGEGEYNLELNIVDKDGKPISGALDVKVDETVTATISGAGAGMQARATKCWATPEADTSDESQMYVLMEDGCAEDYTFSSTIGADNTQSLSFAAFAFTAKTDGSVFLHCNLEACAEGGDCGVCQTSAPRKRRAAMMKKMNKKMTQKNMMTKMIVH